MTRFLVLVTAFVLVVTAYGAGARRRRRLTNVAALASAMSGTSPATSCSPIQFTIGGTRQVPLADAAFGRRAFVNRVQRLLGLRLPKR